MKKLLFVLPLFVISVLFHSACTSKPKVDHSAVTYSNPEAEKLAMEIDQVASLLESDHLTSTQVTKFFGEAAVEDRLKDEWSIDRGAYKVFLRATEDAEYKDAHFFEVKFQPGPNSHLKVRDLSPWLKDFKTSQALRSYLVRANPEILGYKNVEMTLHLADHPQNLDQDILSVLLRRK